MLSPDVIKLSGYQPLPEKTLGPRLMLVLHNLNLINLYMYILIIYVNTGIVLINIIIVH